MRRLDSPRLLLALSVSGLAFTQQALASQAPVVGRSTTAATSSGLAAQPTRTLAAPVANAAIRVARSRSMVTNNKRAVPPVVIVPSRAFESREIARARVATLLILGIGY